MNRKKLLIYLWPAFTLALGPAIYVLLYRHDFSLAYLHDVFRFYARVWFSADHLYYSMPFMLIFIVSVLRWIRRPTKVYFLWVLFVSVVIMGPWGGVFILMCAGQFYGPPPNLKELAVVYAVVYAVFSLVAFDPWKVCARPKKPGIADPA